MATISTKTLGDLERKVDKFARVYEEFNKNVSKLKQNIKAAKRDEYNELHLSRLVNDMVEACSEADQLKFVVLLALDKQDEISKLLGEEWVELAIEAINFKQENSIRDAVKSFIKSLMEDNHPEPEDKNAIVNRVVKNMHKYAKEQSPVSLNRVKNNKK